MRFGGLGADFSRLGVVGKAGSVVVPAAPGLTWNSTSSDATPDFLVDLPNGNTNPVQDAAAGDHLKIEYQLQSGGAWTAYIDRTLSSGDISTDTISVTSVSSVSNGSYYFRARIERGALIGTNSANTSVTVSAGTAPANTVAPVISGNQRVGQVLSTTDGTWTGTATITFTYQWKRDGSNIASATANTYTLVELDAGADITCVVTGTNGFGNSSQASNSLTIDVYLVYLSQILDTADATTYSGGSWNSVSLGVAAANRKIVIAFATRTTTNDPTISSSSVGAAAGSAITAEHQLDIGGSYIWEYANTTDTTANISTTFAASGQLRLGARLYAVYGAGAGTGYHNFQAAGTVVSNASVVIPSGGKAISSFYGVSIGNPGTVSWTNSTEDGTASVIEGTAGTLDSAHSTTTGTMTVTATAGTSNVLFLTTAAYGPS